jgi:tRNA threonylcarbamoyladenosine biosynthesis protein TsaB
VSSDRRYNLAIETSSRTGSVTLGCADEALATTTLPPQVRHRVDLMPAIDALCGEHGATAPQLAEVYVSIGPGSFTGLRIAVAAAKSLALALQVKLVAVPTLDVLAGGAPADDCPEAALAVGLNLKRQSMWTRLYRWSDQQWQATGEAALRSLAQLLADAPRPLAILADPLPPDHASLLESEGDVRLLDASHAVPRSETVWQLGRALARQQQFTDPLELQPLYVRPPEAVELWNQRQGGSPASR